MSREDPFPRRRFARHQHLARSGDRQHSLYRLSEGWACRYRMLRDGRRQIIALYLPGEFCEPEWLIAPEPSFPVNALTPLEVEEIPLAPLAPLCSLQTEPIAGDVLNALHEGCVRQSRMLVGLGRLSAMERICLVMSDLFGRLRCTEAEPVLRATVPLTQQDLADLVGLTPIHVNRTLKALRARNLIEWQGRTVMVSDLAELRSCGHLDPD
jgi:CRP-like cAMP-binding protein